MKVEQRDFAGEPRQCNRVMSQIENDSECIIRIGQHHVAVIGMKLNLQVGRRDWTQDIDDLADSFDNVEAGVCTENLNPDVMVMKSAKDRV